MMHSKKKSHLFVSSNSHRKLRFLIVDDEPVSVQALLYSLKKLCDCDFDIVKNATTAFDLLQKNEFNWKEKGYDIIFMDIYLPDLNGDETANLIKKTIPHAIHVPIIAVSGRVKKMDQEKLKELGIADWITKPITQPLLKDILSQYLSQHRIQ